TSPKDAYTKAGINLVETDKPIFKKRPKIIKNNQQGAYNQSQKYRMRTNFSKFSDSIEIILNNSSKAYSLIPLPKEARQFFPGFKVKFILETDVGNLSPQVTSAPAGTEYGDLMAGNYIQGGLKEWYDSHSELKNGTTLIISVIEPQKRYSLKINQ
ncbi:MAG: hypothetical protein V3S16_04500, partial [Candidatus Desulfatibia sp.]|uniref:hypothetical protein n=1 Tax=Candidatus Desulfatibia sp. TaxID=3101189 RepID=UPI002F300549